MSANCRAASCRALPPLMQLTCCVHRVWSAEASSIIDSISAGYASFQLDVLFSVKPNRIFSCLLRVNARLFHICAQNARFTSLVLCSHFPGIRGSVSTQSAAHKLTSALPSRMVWFERLSRLQGRAALQPVSAALAMNPKERALYLKQKHSTAFLTDDEATVASATPAGLRSFLRQARAFLASILPFLYPIF